MINIFETLKQFVQFQEIFKTISSAIKYFYITINSSNTSKQFGLLTKVFTTIQVQEIFQRRLKYLYNYLYILFYEHMEIVY